MPLNRYFLEVQAHLKKNDMVKKLFFSCNLFQKVKLSYILDSLQVKHFKSFFFFFDDKSL